MTTNLTFMKTTIEQLFAAYILSQDNNNSLYSRIEQAHNEELQDGATDTAFGEYVLDCIEAGGYSNELNCFQAEKETEWLSKFQAYHECKSEELAEIMAEESPDTHGLAERIFGEEFCQYALDVVNQQLGL
jgi:hypothetical protein